MFYLMLKCRIFIRHFFIGFKNAYVIMNIYESVI